MLESGFWVLHRVQGLGFRGQGLAPCVVSYYYSSFVLQVFCKWQQHQELTLQIGSEFALFGHLGKTSEMEVLGFGFWVLGLGACTGFRG